MSEQSVIEVFIYSMADLYLLYANQQKATVIKCARDRLLSTYINQGNLPKNGLIYTQNKYGKPRLHDFPEIKFNQSHTHNFLAIAVNGSNLELGIDIEEKNRNISENIFDYVLNEQELLIVKQADNHHQAFLRIWTIKEAIVKAHGIGISWDMTLINTVNNQHQYCHSELGNWAYQLYEDEQLFACIAYEKQPQIPTITVKRLK